MEDLTRSPGTLWRQLGCLVIALLLAGVAVLGITALGFQDNWWLVMALTVVGGVVILWVVARLFGDHQPAA